MRGKKQATVWNNIEYPSIRIAALSNNIHPNTLGKYLKKGYTSDEDIAPRRRDMPVVWNNIEYPDIKVAAKAIGVTIKAMETRIYQNGYASDEDMKSPKAVIWNDVEYESISAAARALGISRQAMHQRVKKGYTSDADFKQNKYVPK